MAFSKCPKCENPYFEVKENIPNSSNYKLMFVQCAKCGSVAGVLDYYNIGTLVKELEKKIGRNYDLDALNSNLGTINQNIINLFRKIADLEIKINKK